MRRLFFIAIFSALTVCSAWGDIPQTISYQGVLTESDGSVVSDGNYQLTFRLYNAGSGGAALWTETHSSVPVANGVFNVIMGSVIPLTLLFDQQYWLGVTIGSNPELTPLVELTSSAYSLNSRSVADNAIKTNHIADGTVTLADLSQNGASPDQIIKWNGSEWEIAEDDAGVGWSLTGNSGTIPGTNFIGTTDNQAIEFHVNSARALRLEPDLTCPNVIGGSIGNSIVSGAYGSVIGGGGGDTPGLENIVSDNYGTVGGGLDNQAGNDNQIPTDARYATVGGGVSNTADETGATVGGGVSNKAFGTYATVGGGSYNIADGESATIGGGWGNTANAKYATVAGGGTSEPVDPFTGNRVTDDYGTIGGGGNNQAGDNAGTTYDATYATVSGGKSNTASSSYATVSGGLDNIASSEYAIIPGGLHNAANGDCSFAAGYNAKAMHDGSFVWGDIDPSIIASTGTDQFIVRASGGIWFGTNNSVGNPWPSGRFIDTSTGAHLTTGGAWTNGSDRASKDNFVSVNKHDVLTRLAEIPIETWNYKAEGSDIRHIGPVAQDFHAAFGLGADDRHISTVDADGVALAAIQGLYIQLKTQQEQIMELREENAALQQEADNLEERMEVLEKIVSSYTR